MGKCVPILLTVMISLLLPAAAQAQRTTNGLTQDEIDRGCYARGQNKFCPTAPKSRRPHDLPYTELLNRRWGLHIPGGVYQTEDWVNYTRTTHISPGTGLLGALEVRDNGTYTWDTEDGERLNGRWDATNATAIVLHNGFRSVDWKVKLDSRELWVYTGRNLSEQFRGQPMK